MPFYRRSAGKMSDADIGDDVTVVDVYDIASDIGKECEIIIDKFGAEAITSLLPKVINALELLETLATRNERENTTLQDLHDKISQLENDKLEKAEYRQRFEKELEIIEDQWRTETAELVSAVSRLQEENRRLVREREGQAAGAGAAAGGASTTEGEQLWRRLGEAGEQQRAAIRDRDKQLQDKLNIIEGLTSQVKRLAASSREVRRKQKYLLHQMRVVVGQRAELEAAAQARQRELVALRQALANDKSGNGKATELSELLKERDHLKEQLEALQKKIELEAEPSSSGAETSGADDGVVSQGYEEEMEPPVQGPLPCEPDDAPWKRQPSGIRKFPPLCGGPGIQVFGSYFPSTTSPWDPFRAALCPPSQQRWPPPQPSTSERVPADNKYSSSSSAELSEEECSCDRNIPQKTTTTHNQAAQDISNICTSDRKKGTKPQNFECRHLVDSCSLDYVSTVDDLMDGLSSGSDLETSCSQMLPDDSDSEFEFESLENSEDEGDQIKDNSSTIEAESGISGRAVGTSFSSSPFGGSWHRNTGSLPDYGDICRFCLKRIRGGGVVRRRDETAVDLATEIYNVSINETSHRRGDLEAAINVDGLDSSIESYTTCCNEVSLERFNLTRCLPSAGIDLSLGCTILGTVLKSRAYEERFDCSDAIVSTDKSQRRAEFYVCVCAALECLIALWLRHCDHN